MDEEPGSLPMSLENGLGPSTLPPLHALPSSKDTPVSEDMFFSCGSKDSTDELRSIEEIPPQFRNIFEYPRFNRLQSQLIDELLYGDKSLVVSAPTGSGKTVLFELAIVRLMQQLKNSENDSDFKIIYMAPMRALCTERLLDWYKKFNKHGLSCIQATGDSDKLEFKHLKAYKIIMTTPEKWDSLTRKWKENKDIVQQIKLFIIDEVHLLNEDVRGPVLEAVVSRMKTVQETLNPSNSKMKLKNGIRFIAASATIPNAEDIAEWLGTPQTPALCYKIGDEYRAAKLIKVVEGFPCREGQGLFKFDMFLNYKLRSTIEKYCKGKPTLIFCNSRKSVMLAAETLSKEMLFRFTHGQTSAFAEMASQLSDKKLQTLAFAGIGCHHAGFLHKDRNIIEEMFREGKLPILVTTSTLATGVNLPAHLVIIKSTQHYVNGTYADYEESAILQMMGRAGRPQFDTEGIAVIMTRIEDKVRYERLCSGQRAVESKLHRHLAEHLNAEVALGTLPDLLLAMDWLRSTFLYVRATRNPSNYGCSKLADRNAIEKKLQEICIKWMNALARAGMLTMDADTKVFPTDAGILMATYCLDFDTMKLITKGSESMSELIGLISECHEFEDLILRVTEKRCLNLLNRNKQLPSCRFPLSGKIKTKDMKANCLIQAVLGNLPIHDSSLFQDSVRIMKIGETIAKSIVAYLSRTLNATTPVYKALLNAVTLAKCMKAQMWENSDYVSKQLTGIGPAFANLLVSARKTTFESIRCSNPRDLERILNKGPPAGNALKQQTMYLPIYSLKLQPSNGGICLTLSITNGEDISTNGSTAGNSHKLSLIVGDSENNLLFYTTMMDTHILKSSVNRIIELKCKNPHKVHGHVISNTWVGLDIHVDLNIGNVETISEPSTSTMIRNKPTAKKNNLKNQSETDERSKNKSKSGAISTQLNIKEQIDLMMKKIKSSKDIELPCDRIAASVDVAADKFEHNGQYHGENRPEPEIMDISVSDDHVTKSDYTQTFTSTPIETTEIIDEAPLQIRPQKRCISAENNDISDVKKMKMCNKDENIPHDDLENICGEKEMNIPNDIDCVEVDLADMNDSISDGDISLSQISQLIDKYNPDEQEPNPAEEIIENEFTAKTIERAEHVEKQANDTNYDFQLYTTEDIFKMLSDEPSSEEKTETVCKIVNKLIYLTDDSKKYDSIERTYRLHFDKKPDEEQTLGNIDCRFLHVHHVRNFAYKNVRKLGFNSELFSSIKKRIVKSKKSAKPTAILKKKTSRKIKKLQSVEWNNKYTPKKFNGNYAVTEILSPIPMSAKVPKNEVKLNVVATVIKKVSVKDAIADVLNKHRIVFESTQSNLKQNIQNYRPNFEQMFIDDEDETGVGFPPRSPFAAETTYLADEYKQVDYTTSNLNYFDENSTSDDDKMSYVNEDEIAETYVNLDPQEILQSAYKNFKENFNISKGTSPSPKKPQLNFNVRKHSSQFSLPVQSKFTKFSSDAYSQNTSEFNSPDTSDELEQILKKIDMKISMYKNNSPNCPPNKYITANLSNFKSLTQDGYFGATRKNNVITELRNQFNHSNNKRQLYHF